AGGEIGDHQSRDPLLERVEIVLVLPVRAAVVERKYGDRRTGVLSVGLASQSSNGGPHQDGGPERNDRTLEHSMLLEFRGSGSSLLVPPALPPACNATC